MVSLFEKKSPGGEWEPNAELFDYKFDFKKIKKQANRFVFIHSDNDLYCPLEYVKYLSKELDGELIVIKGAGHFSMGSGGERFRKLPDILEILKEK